MQGNQLTGLSHQFNTDFLCDEKRNNRDLHRSWNDREQLSNTTQNTTSMATIQVIPTTQKEAHLLSGPSELQPPDTSEVHLLPRPLKAMAHRYRHQRKKPTFFQDHQNSNRLMTQKLRSSEVQHCTGYPLIQVEIVSVCKSHYMRWLASQSSDVLTSLFLECVVILRLSPVWVQVRLLQFPPFFLKYESEKLILKLPATRQEYSRFTETEKLSFNPIYLYDDRNFVRHILSRNFT